MILHYIPGFINCAIQVVMIIFSIFFYPGGKAGDAQILRCQGIVVKRYDFTLGALVLRFSGFYNNRVNLRFKIEAIPK